MRFFERRTERNPETLPAWPAHADAVRVLLIDDDEDEFALLRDTFRDIRGTTFQLEWVASYGEGLSAVAEGRYDAYLVDYRLGSQNGVDLVREARTRGSEAPLIMLTGEGARSVDVEAMEAGATDYLEKGRTPAALLERTIRYAVTQAATTAALRTTLRQISGIEALGRLLAEQGASPDALDEVMRLIGDEFGVDAASLYLMEVGLLRLAAVRGYEYPLTEVDPGSGRLGRVLQSGRAQLMPMLTIDPDHRSLEDPPEFCLPLLAEGQTLGILNVRAGTDGVGESLERALRLIADRLAVALALNRAIRGRSYIG